MEAAAQPGPGFLPSPADGRTFTAAYTVRSADVAPDGRLRFDALARYLQDAAEDDIADAGLSEPYGWLLRRCAVSVRGFPRYRQRIRLVTFCSATGPRWAERTTTVSAAGRDLIQARAVWAAVDGVSGRPLPLGASFQRLYGPAAGGRQVSARLSHPQPGATGAGRPWPLRASDFDTAGHVNNSVHWAAVEDVLAGLGWLPGLAEVEYHRPVLPGYQPRLVISGNSSGARARAWLLNGTHRLASALIAR